MILGLGTAEFVVVLAVTLVPLAIVLNAVRKEPPAPDEALAPGAGLMQRVWWLYTQSYRKYGTLRGRATLREFWTFSLINALVGNALSGADLALGLTSSWSELGPISGIFAFITLIPGIAVSVRRLHDGGRSGWWISDPLLSRSSDGSSRFISSLGGGLPVTTASVVDPRAPRMDPSVQMGPVGSA